MQQARIQPLTHCLRDSFSKLLNQIRRQLGVSHDFETLYNICDELHSVRNDFVHSSATLARRRFATGGADNEKALRMFVNFE